jgi:hypothetical protein
MRGFAGADCVYISDADYRKVKLKTAQPSLCIKKIAQRNDAPIDETERKKDFTHGAKLKIKPSKKCKALGTHILISYCTVISFTNSFPVTFTITNAFPAKSPGC